MCPLGELWIYQVIIFFMHSFTTFPTAFYKITTTVIKIINILDFQWLFDRIRDNLSLGEEVVCTCGCTRVSRHNVAHPPQSYYALWCMLSLNYQGFQFSMFSWILHYELMHLQHIKRSLKIFPCCFLANFFIFLSYGPWMVWTKQP